MKTYRVCDDKTFTLNGVKHEEGEKVELDENAETTKAALAAKEIAAE